MNVIEVPIAADCGTDAAHGRRGMTVKLGPASVPATVVTLTAPLLAPAGTVAVIWVAESTVKVVALVALNFTTVAPERLVPVIVTDVPTGPLAGFTSVTSAAEMTVKLGPASVPPGVVTLTAPVVAPAGTVAVIWVAESTREGGGAGSVELSRRGAGKVGAGDRDRRATVPDCSAGSRR